MENNKCLCNYINIFQNNPYPLNIWAYNENNEFYLGCDGEGYTCLGFNFKINYCPICGRKLNGE